LAVPQTSAPGSGARSGRRMEGLTRDPRRCYTLSHTLGLCQALSAVARKRLPTGTIFGSMSILPARVRRRLSV